MPAQEKPCRVFLCRLRAWPHAGRSCEHVGVFGDSYDGDSRASVARREDAPSGGDLERRRPGELTPSELLIRRRNRRWLVTLAIPALVLGVAALAATLLASASANKPGVNPLAVPAGYKAVSDGVFAYAVPSGWSTSETYSDDAGDLDTAGSQGWIAEHVDTRTQAPVMGEAPPTVFADFGEPKPTPYHISAGEPVRLSGVNVSYRYLITREGFQATAIDAWLSRSRAEIWLLIDADPATTRVILSSFTSSP
jgi:hypothetical protein